MIHADKQKDLVILVAANLLNASIYIALLYLRKLYIFSKISRKILKERRENLERNTQYEPFADYNQQYGAFKSDPISWNNIQDKISYRNHATRSPFEKDGGQEDNVSSCGSVKSSSSQQVQCQELYPMDVYEQQDNQLGNSKMGQSTRSVYDMIDDANLK